MKYKHRRKPSCIAKSIYALSDQFGTNSAREWQTSYSAEPRLNLPSQESLLAETPDLPTDDGFQTQDGLECRINLLFHLHRHI